MSVQPTRSVVHSESGIALLGTVLVTALVLGLAAWGVLKMTGNAQQSVYGENTANQARTAALMGIQAITGYAQSVYVKTNPPSLANLDYKNTPGLANRSGPVDQLFNQPTNANVQAMVKFNAFSGTSSLVGASANGFIRVLSTGRSGPAIQTAESYLTAQLNSLSKYNANLILGSGSTFNGSLNKGGVPNVVVASTAPTASQSGITLNGTTYTYVPISYFPVINPGSYQQYSTIQLVGDSIYIPASAIKFYLPDGTDNLFGTSPPLSGVSYTCTYNACPSSLTDYFSYVAGSSGSLGTWTINNPVNAFIYSDQNINVGFDSGTSSSQLTVATAGTINSSGKVTLYPFASEQTPATTNYCSTNPGLPICDPQTGSPYLNLQGLIYVSTGSISAPGKGSSFYGDVATSGSLTLNGGGSYTFGGTIVAENGISTTSGESGHESTTVNGAITLTAPVAAANSATLGGYQIVPSSIRWVP
ncbi:hypothetical protein ACSDBR_06695 [Acidithiobacillus ferriphilus]|uniref:hypothetical protein n=1 Tax=Acidithiobacillus ferriphilus TaxID=1689834 RepID=UPI003F50E909